MNILKVLKGSVGRLSGRVPTKVLLECTGSARYGIFISVG